ncbi:MAG: hypothetical protein QM831_16635 [Kofleriaceae bacterium]
MLPILIAVVMDKLDVYDANLKITVNDMPIERGYPYEYPDKGTPYLPVPDYLLHTGKNTLHVTFTEVNPKPQHDLDVRLVELKTLDPQTITTELVHITAAGDYTFEVKSTVPAHAYTTSPPIKPAMEAKLKESAKALAAAWNKTKKLTTTFEQPRDQNVDRLARWLSHPKLSMDLRADEAAMEIIGNGHLAHLVWQGTLMPWFIRGGAYDAPAGSMGPVDIQMDVWFRLDSKGNFVPAAVWQVGVAPDRL